MSEITVPATLMQLGVVLDFINLELDAAGCPPGKRFQVNIAAEEIFVNITHYAYRGKKGKVTVRFWAEGNPLHAVIQFIDQGIPYNPLERKDPEISIGAMEREPGGLGIYIVKKVMDSVEYTCDDSRNILTIKKDIST